MSELDEILNDDLLKCKIVETVENEAIRADLIKWTHDKTYSIAVILKDTGELEVTHLKASCYPEAYKFFCKNYGKISTIS